MCAPAALTRSIPSKESRDGNGGEGDKEDASQETQKVESRRKTHSDKKLAGNHIATAKNPLHSTATIKKNTHGVFKRVRGAILRHPANQARRHTGATGAVALGLGGDGYRSQRPAGVPPG